MSGRAGEGELKKDGILTRESTAQNDGINYTYPVAERHPINTVNSEWEMGNGKKMKRHLPRRRATPLPE